MNNRHISDVQRQEKVMKMLDEFEPNCPRKIWRFFVTSKKENVIFGCVSSKQVVTEEELYRIVVANLPDDMDIGQLLGATAGYSGHCFIQKNTDLALVFDLICN